MEYLIGFLLFALGVSLAFNWKQSIDRPCGGQRYPIGPGPITQQGRRRGLKREREREAARLSTPPLPAKLNRQH